MWNRKGASLTSRSSQPLGHLLKRSKPILFLGNGNYSQCPLAKSLGASQSWSCLHLLHAPRLQGMRQKSHSFMCWMYGLFGVSLLRVGCQSRVQGSQCWCPPQQVTLRVRVVGMSRLSSQAPHQPHRWVLWWAPTMLHIGTPQTLPKTVLSMGSQGWDWERPRPSWSFLESNYFFLSSTSKWFLFCSLWNISISTRRPTFLKCCWHSKQMHHCHSASWSGPGVWRCFGLQKLGKKSFLLLPEPCPVHRPHLSKGNCREYKTYTWHKQER